MTKSKDVISPFAMHPGHVFLVDLLHYYVLTQLLLLAQGGVMRYQIVFISFFSIELLALILLLLLLLVINLH
jgi:hypothetical protein